MKELVQLKLFSSVTVSPLAILDCMNCLWIKQSNKQRTHYFKKLKEQRKIYTFKEVFIETIDIKIHGYHQACTNLEPLPSSDQENHSVQ